MLIKQNKKKGKRKQPIKTTNSKQNIININKNKNKK